MQLLCSPFLPKGLLETLPPCCSSAEETKSSLTSTFSLLKRYGRRALLPSLGAARPSSADQARPSLSDAGLCWQCVPSAAHCCPGTGLCGCLGPGSQEVLGRLTKCCCLSWGRATALEQDLGTDLILAWLFSPAYKREVWGVVVISCCMPQGRALYGELDRDDWGGEAVSF